MCQLSIYNSFPVIRTTIAKIVIFNCKKSSFLRTPACVEWDVKPYYTIPYRTPAFIFCLPWGRPCGNYEKRCMNEKTIQCLQNPRSMYPSIFNSFPVIRTASAKNRRFRVPQLTFLFPLETPQQLSRNMLHGWKYNSMLAKPPAACTHLSSIASELYDA